MLKDWDIVVEFMHYNGAFHDFLSQQDFDHFFWKGNGFGEGLNFAQKKAIGYDWSHIRDSSEEAISAIASAIRRHPDYNRFVVAMEKLEKKWAKNEQGTSP